MNRRRFLFALAALALVISLGSRIELNSTYAPFSDTDQISGSVTAGFWTGSISITKDTDPNDETNFDFTAGGAGISPANFDLEDDGDEADGQVKVQTFDNLDAGTYTFVELGETGYTITGISCEIAGGNGSSYAIQGVSDDAVFDDGEDTVEVTLVAGDAVNCTFTNELVPAETGTIKIIKDVQPGTDAQDFTFSDDIPSPCTIGTLDDDGSGDNFITCTGVPVGSYQVSETSIPTGWSVAQINCIELTGGDDGSTGAGVTASIDLDDGETVECTFVNVPIPASAFFLDSPSGNVDNMFVTPNTGNRTVQHNGGEELFRAPANAVASADNSADWIVNLVDSGRPTVATTLTITIWWEDSTCTSPVAGQIFATSTENVSPITDGAGYTLTMDAVAGTVSHTFDSDDRLCMLMHNNGTASSQKVTFRTGTVSTLATVGLFSTLEGPMVRN